MALDDLIGTDEAARLLGVPKPTVKRMAKAGTLPHAMKMPGKTGAYLFRREDVAAFIDRSIVELTNRIEALTDRLEAAS